jgi:hypothetical protein
MFGPLAISPRPSDGIGGFLVFAIGEGIILLSGPAAGLAGSIPAFAAGTALWGTALLLVSIPKLFAAPPTADVRRF